MGSLYWLALANLMLKGYHILAKLSSTFRKFYKNNFFRPFPPPDIPTAEWVITRLFTLS